MIFKSGREASDSAMQYARVRYEGNGMLVSVIASMEFHYDRLLEAYNDLREVDPDVDTVLAAEAVTDG